MDLFGRPSCLRCFRPTTNCICRHFSEGPLVENRTGVVILQHPRERFHPLGTARIARLGLSRVRVEVSPVRRDRSLTHRLELPPKTGLLYPHAQARRLDSVPPSAWPAHLLVLDGTWAHARQLYRENRWLGELPHFELAPSEPGRYRIRGEPHLHCLSTVEAIVQSLQVLEPQTPGLESLLGVFDAMIDAQVEQIEGNSAGPRRKRPRQRPSRRVPALLARQAERLLVAYVETVPGPGGQRLPVHWVALRPSTGESFERLLRPGGAPPNARQLAHMGLIPSDLEHGLPLPQLQQDWSTFLGDTPVVAAWNQSTLDLLSTTVPAGGSTVMLKAAYSNVHLGACGSLEAVMEREGLEAGLTPGQGRAGQRLGMALAVLVFLQQQVEL